jgi:2-polyprenyl-6-methoxyphenol hydroxylase-like FAD-dependent oxidoreductase
MTEIISTTCCISGGGPAGLMLGLLLARAGVEVTVLEKHKDFLRDFRGDTIHPSTMQTLEELGLLDDFLKLPHQPARGFSLSFGDESVALADFSRLPVRAPFIAMMPQWDFLNFLSAEAARQTNFRLLMETEAMTLIETGGRIGGLIARSGNKEVRVNAALTVAADGRGSILRAGSGIPLTDHGAPIDVLWFKLSRKRSDPEQIRAQFRPGRAVVMINRGRYWQCAFLINKGGLEAVRAAGLASFRSGLASALPFEAGRVDELTGWDQIKLLNVQVNRLTKWWRPGFLCIGDAAHAMSPVGGVGINLAIQDAVATANLLAGALAQGKTPGDDLLAAVQARREFPTRMTQRIQLAIQDRILAATLSAKGKVRPPLSLRIILSLPGFRRLPTRLLGLGVQPEHIGPDLSRLMAA